MTQGGNRAGGSAVRARREADEGVCLPRSVKVNHDRLSLADKVAQLACAAVLGNQVHIDERLPDKSCTPHIPDLAADQRTKSQVQMASLRVNSADSVMLQYKVAIGRRHSACDAIGCISQTGCHCS